MYELLLSADNHLRDRQFARSDRGDDFRAAFGQIFTYAINKKLDAVLLAGDVLDVKRPSPENITFLLDLHDSMVQAGIPVLCVSGDHDHTYPHWIQTLRRKREQNEGVKGGFYLLRNETFTLTKEGEPDLTVHGLDYIGKDKLRYLATQEQIPATHVLLWHTTVQEFSGFPTPEAISLREFPLNKHMLIGIGDIHATEEASLADDTLVISPGSTELVKQNEGLLKTFHHIRISPDSHPGNITFERVPIKTRKALRFKCGTEEEVTAMLVEVAKYRQQNPIVFVDYKSTLEAVPGRLYSTLDGEKAIIRPRRLTDDSLVEGIIEDEADIEDDEKKPEDFVHLWLTPGTPLFNVATQLCDEKTNVADTLDDYIKSRTKAIELAARESV